ncbi:hypothetical protein JTE90_010104 [Oedothorax gibbosus]|uniref:IRF tryptophan pentad repeat domain-containing protein n=1 Tax=Oedothorax gibbosus TaxID=931172 RepID=A0AAV6U615_9ARAC|nr:hypothetical protein JTE90_010104 [Oedothorax gibbosus]
MGRKASQLIPFLIDALERQNYSNLKFEDPINWTFSLFLPQKSAKLEESCQLVLKGWFRVRRRRYRLNLDYTEAKQCFEAALRKSDFLELISKGRKQKQVYRFLDQNEIQEKKNLKRKNKKKLERYQGSGIAPSPGSSGYGSGSDHAEEVYEGEENLNLVHGLNHDHKYIKKSEIVIVSDDIPQSFGNANPSNRTEVLFHDGLNRIVETPGTTATSYYPVGPVEYIGMVTDPIAIERQTYEKEYERMVTHQTIAIERDTYEIEHDRMITDQTIAIGRQAYEKEYDDMVPVQAPIGNNEAQEFRNLQLGSVKDAAPCVEEVIPREKSLSYWDTLNPSRRTFENPYGNLDLSRPPDYLFSEEEDPPLQDPDKMDNNTQLSDVELNDDFVMNSEKHTKEEILTPIPTNLDIFSYNTKLVKVYECRQIQNLPGMIMLTCEPKMKEFCTTDVTEIGGSRPQLIFDEATMELVSKCTIENLQLLSNDYLLFHYKLDFILEVCIQSLAIQYGAQRIEADSIFERGTE